MESSISSVNSVEAARGEGLSDTGRVQFSGNRKCRAWARGVDGNVVRIDNDDNAT